MTALDSGAFLREWVWNSKENINEIAEKMKMTPKKVSQLSAQFRKKGVFLKTMRKGPGKSLDFDKLVEYSNKFRKETPQAPGATGNPQSAKGTESHVH